MEKVLDSVGSYTWGLVPSLIRGGVWWLCLGLFAFLVYYFVTRLHKVDPKNIRGYNPWGPHRPAVLGWRDDKLFTMYPEEVADRNALFLGYILIVVILLVLVLALRLVGNDVFGSPVVNTTMSEKQVKVGQVVGISRGKGYVAQVYICTDTVLGPEFVTKGRHGDYSQGSHIEEVKSLELVSAKPMWWGTKKVFAEQKVRYSCVR